MFVIGWLLNVSSINNGDTLKCLFIFSRVIIEVRKCIIGGSYGILNILFDNCSNVYLLWVSKKNVHLFEMIFI